MFLGRASVIALGMLTLGVATVLIAQQPSKDKSKGATADYPLVERLMQARQEYQKALQDLRNHYIASGDNEKAALAEEELKAYHRMLKHPYNLKLEVPPETLQRLYNIPEANELFRQAIQYKEKSGSMGFVTQDYIDNQRRAELLFQQILTKYPQSDKISDVAYQLGELYEGRAYKQYARAAMYYERCFQWNSKTQLDARLRAGASTTSSSTSAAGPSRSTPRSRTTRSIRSASPRRSNGWRRCKDASDN